MRNSKASADVIYFGPMGCRTGFYLVMFGEQKPQDVYNLIVDMCKFITDFDGDIPGARPEECGNYADQDLGAAKKHITNYLQKLKYYKRFSYKSLQRRKTYLIIAGVACVCCAAYLLNKHVRKM